MTLAQSPQLTDAIGRALRCLAPPSRMSVAEWAESRMRLPDTSAISGPFSLSVTPYLRSPLEDLTDPDVREVAGMKSSQIGWSVGVVMSWIGYSIDQDQSSMIVMFPRDRTARDFNLEKFEPVVQASPALSTKIDVKTRSRDYRQDHKTFPGGFVKFVGSNSTGGVKSTSARRLIVEEPDDCNVNLKGQGDSIELLRDRGKSFADAKLLVGGTPTVKGISSIEAEMDRSDQRYWYVPCHHCEVSAPLEWEMVRWTSDESATHPVYGHALPETAHYVCASCGGEWTSAEKVANSARGEWRSTAPFRGIRGYYFNELMSPFADSSLARLAEKYLAAMHEANHGNVGPLIAFTNGSLGRSWEWKNDVPEEDDIKARALAYEEWTVPAGGLIVTAGVDVQHDRLAVIVRAWGRGEESWLVWWGELFGNVLEAPVWKDLYQTLFGRTIRHASGAELGVAAVSIDASDGQTDDAVYNAVRDFNRQIGKRRCMAVKGASIETKDIFSAPRKIEYTHRHKAAKYGLGIYMVGVARAKDLILGGEGGGRLKLVGTGPGRLHVYRSVRPDYFEQLVSEVKAPAPGGRRGMKVWQKKSGKRNEALDAEIYALHAARSVRVNVFSEVQWTEVERAILQSDLIASAPARSPEGATEVQTSARSPVPAQAAAQAISWPPHESGRVARPPGRNRWPNNGRS